MGRIADTISGTMRRRQRDREPRVLLYDASGQPRVVQPGTDAHAGLVKVAQRLVDAAGGPPPEEAPAGDGGDA
jgi:hypothetical protein